MAIPSILLKIFMNCLSYQILLFGKAIHEFGTKIGPNISLLASLILIHFLKYVSLKRAIGTYKKSYLFFLLSECISLDSTKIQLLVLYGRISFIPLIKLYLAIQGYFSGNFELATNSNSLAFVNYFE